MPVFFPPVTHEALKFLVSPEARKNAGVHDGNEYIFANTQKSLQYASGWHCVNEMLTEVGKKGAFNATKNRHRIATILAKMNLTDYEQNLIFEHFGHSKTINQTVYQAAAGSQQINCTAKVLLKVNFYCEIFL